MFKKTKNTWKKRIGALMMCAVMMVTAACGNKSDEQANTQQTDGTSDTESVGRFVEKDVESPAGSNYVMHSVLREDGTIEMWTSETSDTATTTIRCTTKDGETWEKENAPEWYDKMQEENSYISCLAPGPNGQYYIIYTKMSEDSMALNDRYYVAKVKEDGTLEEIDMDWYVLAYDSEEAKPADFTVTQSSGSALAVTTTDETQTEDSAAEETSATTQPIETATDTEETDTADQTPETAETSETAETAETDETDETPMMEYYDEAYYNSRPQPMGLYVLDNGELLISDRGAGVIHYDANGQYVRAYPGSVYGEIVVADHKLYMYNYEEGITAFDLQTGEKNQLSTPGSESVTGNILIAADQEHLYCIDGQSIYQMDITGDQWSAIGDISATTLALPTAYTESCYVLGDQTFIFYVQAGTFNNKWVSLQYDENGIVPSIDLNVYTMSYSYRLRQAAVEFQKKNPEVRVNITQANTYEEGNATKTDAIKALNTELLAGKGPDVLVLDDLPIDSYIEKEVLVDLSDIVESSLSSGGYLEKVVRAYQSNDGKVYATPTGFTLSMLMGQKEAIENGTTLDDIIVWAIAHPEERAFYYMAPQAMMYRFYNICSPDFLDENGAIKAEEFAQYLTNIKMLADTAEGKNDPSAESMQQYEEYLGTVTDATELWSTREMLGEFEGSYSFAGKEVSFHLQNFEGTSELEYVQSYIKVHGNAAYAPMSSANGQYTFTPMEILGVNANSQQQEYAKKFIETVLSDTVQSMEAYSGGCPVKIDVLKVRELREEEGDGTYFMGTSTASGKMLTLEVKPLTQEQIDAFKSVCNMVDTASIIDDQLFSIIIEETEPFFAGTMTAEEAAAAVVNRSAIMMNE